MMTCIYLPCVQCKSRRAATTKDKPDWGRDTSKLKYTPLTTLRDNERIIYKISSEERHHLIFPDRLFNFLIDSSQFHHTSVVVKGKTKFCMYDLPISNDTQYYQYMGNELIFPKASMYDK